jgi:cytochrome bd-type quinol oxidase subunit 2
MKYFYSLIFLVITLFNINFVQASVLQGNVLGEMTNNTTALQNKAGYDPAVTVGTVVASVVKGFLALLGIIFVILLILAGYNWMTAAGDEDKINKAKDTIKAAIIGLIIVVAAYSITYFIFQNLPGGSGTPGNL